MARLSLRSLKRHFAMNMFFTFLRSFLVLALLALTCVSSPINFPLAEKRGLLPNRVFPNGPNLRILPLGDSITWGYLSSTGNGYRLDLLNLLSGNTVQYIGSQRSGSMADNYNEGHSGAVILDIAAYANYSLPERPNVVLLMAGTNDVNLPHDPKGAPARLAALIDEIIAECPDAAVLIAQITPISNPSAEARAETFNAAIPGIVADRVNAGKHIPVVDMHSAVPVSDLADGLHPNDVGYNDMATAWYAAIVKAANNGWITSPINSVGTTSLHNYTACTTALYWDPKYGQIASGVGSGDPPFSPGWESVGTLHKGGVGNGSNLGAGVRLADLDGDGRDDYVWVDPVTGGLILYLNGGYNPNGVTWINKGQIATGVGGGPGVMFADLDGDGRDDYIWVAEDGTATSYRNGGENPSGGWLWYTLGVIIQGTGGTRATTRFADIDGDGRAEYLIVGASSGSLTAWFNSGIGDAPDWVPLGEIASGIGDAAGVHLEDLNNDGRADYIWLDSNGAATVYINTRGSSTKLAPNWISAGIIATGVGTSGNNITFGDLNGDGQKDYMFVHTQGGAIDVWLNTGSGGTFVTGDGTRFGDMNADGLDDYIFMAENGAMTVYLNDGWDSVAKQWIWVNRGMIASGAGVRKDIRLADLDGDGLADYLVVDETTGAVTFWRNGGADTSAPNGWTWINEGQVASGVGPGVGVQFADIDGDGKVDYLWIDPKGAVTAYLNGGPQSGGGWLWYPQGQIASGVGAARKDIQFHDLDGDGLADYLWVSRIDGSFQEWKNGGAKPGGGWLWYPQGQISQSDGANGMGIQFADLTGDGRSDYLAISPSSGAVSMWYNSCTS